MDWTDKWSCCSDTRCQLHDVENRLGQRGTVLHESKDRAPQNLDSSDVESTKDIVIF